MAQKIRDVMTSNPTVLSTSTPISEAAGAMRDRGIGSVIVRDDGSICGIVTDRDIAVRAVAESRDPKATKLGDICSRELTTLSPDDSIDKAVDLMRQKSIRRLPVVEGKQPVGIVSLGDLAMERDPKSALGDISAAPPNR
jgi:CBS domain-containing protein